MELPSVPRVLPASQATPASLHEYLLKLHFSSARWKIRRRNSWQYQLCRAETRLAQWAREYARAGRTLEEYLLRVAEYRGGWPIYSVDRWLNGARFVYAAFAGARR